MRLVIDAMTATVELFGSFGLSWKFFWLWKNQESHIEDGSTVWKLSKNTLEAVLKPIVTEKCEIEYSDRSKKYSILGLHLDYKDSDAKIKIHHFCTEYSFSSKEMLLEPLLEDFKLAVVEEY